MPKKEMIRLALELDDAHALALAQFVKRVGWSEMRGCAADEFETYLIRDALDAVARKLAEHGYAPR